MRSSIPMYVPDRYEVERRYMRSFHGLPIGDTEMHGKELGLDQFFKNMKAEHGGQVMRGCAEYLSRLGYDEASQVLLEKVRDEEKREAEKR